MTVHDASDKVHGWTLVAHPLFLAQVGDLAREVVRLRQKDPTGYTNKNASKRLKAILALALETIPQDPSRSEYRQGDTLGKEYKHWRRAKFFQQYRLFFRYDSGTRVIVYAWVNDEDTKRAYGSSNDAYRLFGRMLDKGNPPDDWEALMKAGKPLVDPKALLESAPLEGINVERSRDLGRDTDL